MNEAKSQLMNLYCSGNERKRISLGGEFLRNHKNLNMLGYYFKNYYGLQRFFICCNKEGHYLYEFRAFFRVSSVKELPV